MIAGASRAPAVLSVGALLALLGLAVVPSSAATRPAAADSIATLGRAVPDSIPLAGHVVYVDFWASWCVPCRSSFPWMATLEAEYRARGLKVITVNLDRDPAAARKFLAETKSSLPVIYDSGGALAQQYRLEVMPTSFIYGRDGRLRARHEGFHPRDSAALEAEVSHLLEEKSAP